MFVAFRIKGGRVLVQGPGRLVQSDIITVVDLQMVNDDLLKLEGDFPYRIITK